MKIRNLLAGLPALALLALSACDEGIDRVVPKVEPGVYVLGLKYGKAGMSSLDRVSGGALASVVPGNGTPAHSNVGLSVAGGSLLLLDRTLGTATAFDLGGDFETPSFDRNLGSASNPQNAARLGDRLWFALYGSSKLVGRSVSDGSEKTIDLSAYNEKTASVPYVAAVESWNGKLVAVLQRLDANFDPADTSLVLVIDPSSSKVEKRIALPFLNPYDVDLRGDLLLLGCTGGWGSNTDGGLVLVDLAAGSVKTSIASSTLGGDPSSVAFVGDAKAWAGLDLGWPDTKALPVDLSSGTKGDFFASATAVSDLAFDGSSLWIANHDDASPYVFQVDPATGAQKARFTASLAPGALKVLK